MVSEIKSFLYDHVSLVSWHILSEIGEWKEGYRKSHREEIILSRLTSPTHIYSNNNNHHGVWDTTLHIQLNTY